MTIAEEWRLVVGYEGLYEVSNLGHVRSVPRAVNSRWGTPVLRKGMDLAPNIVGPYARVTLTRDNVKKIHFIHILVLEAFVGARPEGCQGCHGPAGSMDNSLVNLRWGTISENHMDKHRDGTMPLGEKHHHSKLKTAEIIDIREALARGERPSHIGRKYGVNGSAIGAIRDGRSWAHVA